MYEKAQSRGYDLRSLPTLDMLVEVKKRLSYRVSLDNLARATLNAPKSADGMQALQWWKEGNLASIAEYCRKDVEITRDVYLFGHRDLAEQIAARDLLELVPVERVEGQVHRVQAYGFQCLDMGADQRPVGGHADVEGGVRGPQAFEEVGESLAREGLAAAPCGSRLPARDRSAWSGSPPD